MLSIGELVFAYPRGGGRALDRVSLDIAHGTTVAVVGPSGAGKTTLLRAVAGLLHPQSGDIRLDGDSLLHKPPQERRIALVAQDDALFANMSVRENLRFALRRGNGREESVRATAAALHVERHLDRRPRQLSGGERQRASIARALLSAPVALLLDEPLAHLDPWLRRSLRDEVIGIRRRFTGPILYVTHDHVEATSVGDLLAVLVDGRIEDVGDPQRVFDSPRSLAVARFLGERPMNLFEHDGYIAGIRPEHIRLCADGVLRGCVTRRENTGADAYIEVETEHGVLSVRVPSSTKVRVGDSVALELPSNWMRRFDRTSGTALA